MAETTGLPMPRPTASAVPSVSPSPTPIGFTATTVGSYSIRFVTCAVSCFGETDSIGRIGFVPSSGSTVQVGTCGPVDSSLLDALTQKAYQYAVRNPLWVAICGSTDAVRVAPCHTREMLIANLTGSCAYGGGGGESGSGGLSSAMPAGIGD